MNTTEKRSVISLSSIYAFRMLGLFMLLPILSLYTTHLKDATPALIGMALGIYGLTQAALQIPFGMLSDHIGRKPVIVAGLLLFTLGSIIAALSTSIHGIIIGRAIQGAGAIGSTIMALVADATLEKNRTKAMATIGLTIGTSFIIAMALGPVINAWFHLQGIFWLTSILALLGILVLYFGVPTPPRHIIHRDVETIPQLFGKILKNPNLARLNVGIFSLHAILTALFIVLPILLTQQVHLASKAQPYFYIPILVLAFLAMVPFIIIAEKRRKMKRIFTAAILILGITQLTLHQFHSHIASLGLSVFIFFTAFCLLEATLPSLVSKLAPAGSKGTAMGLYSSCQFFGIFIGGSVGGWVFSQFGINAVFLFTAILAFSWFIAAATMPNPEHVSSKLINLGPIDTEQANTISRTLNSMHGVAEAVIIADKQGGDYIAHLKIDRNNVNEEELAQFGYASEQ